MAKNNTRVNFALKANGSSTPEEADPDLTENPYDDPVVSFEIVTGLEDLTIDLVEKVYLDMQINGPGEHWSVINQVDHILNKITLDLEHLNAKLLEVMSSVVKDLIYIKNQPVSSTEDGLLLLEEFSEDTTSHQHGGLSMEDRLRKLAQFVMRMRQCTENFAVEVTDSIKESERISDSPGCAECSNAKIQQIQSCSMSNDEDDDDKNISVILEPEEIVRNSISKLSSKAQNPANENSYQAIGGYISESDLAKN